MNKILFLFLIPISLFAQRNPNSEYWNTWCYMPKDGIVQKFEAAAAEKTKKYNANPENMIVTFKVLTGDDAGSYERIMPFQSAKSYDQKRSVELQYWADNVGKYCDALGGQQRWMRLKWADVNIDPKNQNPSKYLQKITYMVKPDRLDHFYRWAERIGEIAAERMPDQARLMFRLESGGPRNMFVTYLGFNSYERQPLEFDTTWEEGYDQMFGIGTWDWDLENYLMSLEMIVGQRVETLELVEALLP